MADENFSHLAATMPAPPVDMIMPDINGTIALVNWSVALVVAAFIAYQSIRAKTPIPLLMLLGALLASPQEAIYDIVGAVWYPVRGAASPVFTVFGAAVPAWIAPAYIWYVGGLGYLMYRTFERGVTRQRLVSLYFLFWGLNFLLEMPGLNLGIYAYYGDQPFRLFRFPLWMSMTNAVMPIVLGAACYRLRPLLTGPRVLLIVPIVPMATGFAQIAVGWPTWMALNSGRGPALTHAAAIVSFGLSLTVIYLVGLLFCTVREQASVRGVPARVPAY